MFANGGPSGIGAYEIRDKLTGEILIDLSKQPDFINTPFFNPYKILSDDSLEKGSAVLSILQEFKERDAPQIGPFQMGEDVGTNIADLGFGIARATEPAVRGLSRVFGEVTGFQPAKDFGGKQKFSPSIGLGGIDLFKPTYDSYVPTDQDRARAMVNLLKVPGAVQDFSDRVKEQGVFDNEVSPSFDFRDEDIKSKVSQGDYDSYQKTIEPIFDPYNDPITPMLDELSGQSQELRDRFEKENVQRPSEIEEALEFIKPIEQTVDVDKTEADTLAENAVKFSGLSEDEFKSTLDEMALPKLPEIERPVTDTAVAEQEELRKQNDPISRKLDQPGFFGSDRFLNFIRNVGGELTRTGQMGAGLAGGASKAAEERAARELMADKEERDFASKLRLAQAEAALDAANAGPYDKDKIKTYVEFEGKLTGALKDFDEDERIVSDLNKILNEDINDPNAFGVKGFITKISEDLRAAAGMGEKDWNNLSAAKRTDLILKTVTQRSVRDILGESGKTISNLDRELVADIFGSVNVFTTPAELKKKLTDSRAQIIESMRTQQDTITSNATALQEAGYPSRVLQNNIPLLQRILNFDFDNIESYRLGDNSSGYIETTL